MFFRGWSLLSSSSKKSASPSPNKGNISPSKEARSFSPSKEKSPFSPSKEETPFSPSKEKSPFSPSKAQQDTTTTRVSWASDLDTTSFNYDYGSRMDSFYVYRTPELPDVSPVPFGDSYNGLVEPDPINYYHTPEAWNASDRALSESPGLTYDASTGLWSLPNCRVTSPPFRSRSPVHFQDTFDIDLSLGLPRIQSLGISQQDYTFEEPWGACFPSPDESPLRGKTNALHSLPLSDAPHSPDPAFYPTTTPETTMTSLREGDDSVSTISTSEFATEAREPSIFVDGSRSSLYFKDLAACELKEIAYSPGQKRYSFRSATTALASARKDSGPSAEPHGDRLRKAVKPPHSSAEPVARRGRRTACVSPTTKLRILRGDMSVYAEIGRSPREAFVCPVEGCLAIFKIRSQMARHAAIHDSTTRYTCDRCGDSFTRKDNLVTHLRYTCAFAKRAAAAKRSPAKQSSPKRATPKRAAKPSTSQRSSRATSPSKLSASAPKRTRARAKRSKKPSM